MSKPVKLIIYGLIGSLLILTSSTSYDFMRRTMPPGQQYLAIGALAALGIGAVGWTLFFKQAVGWPKWLALVLMVVDVTGEVSMFLADLYLNGSSTLGLAQLTPETINQFLLALGGVVAANIAIGLMVDVTDPDALVKSHELDSEYSRMDAELEIRKIEHQAEIENRKALAKAIKERARTYNQQRIPQLLDAWQSGAELGYQQVETNLRQGYKPMAGRRGAAPQLPDPEKTQIVMPFQPKKAMVPAPAASIEEKKIGFDAEVAGPRYGLHYQSASGQEATVAVAESVQRLQPIALNEKGQYMRAWIVDPSGKIVWEAPEVRAAEVIKRGPLPLP